MVVAMAMALAKSVCEVKWTNDAEPGDAYTVSFFIVVYLVENAFLSIQNWLIFMGNVAQEAKWFVVGQTKNRWSRNDATQAKSVRTLKGVEWMGEKERKKNENSSTNSVCDSFVAVFTLNKQNNWWIRRNVLLAHWADGSAGGRMADERRTMGSSERLWCRVRLVGNDARLLLNLSGAFE